jgi:hypothetical protein
MMAKTIKRKRRVSNKTFVLKHLISMAGDKTLDTKLRLAAFDGLAAICGIPEGHVVKAATDIQSPR